MDLQIQNFILVAQKRATNNPKNPTTDFYSKMSESTLGRKGFNTPTRQEVQDYKTEQQNEFFPKKEKTSEHDKNEWLREDIG